MSNVAAIAAAAVTQNNSNNHNYNQHQHHHQHQHQHSQSNMNVSGSSSNNSVVGLHYKIGKKIGEGSFGVLFEGSNIINGVAVAIKFEPRKTEAPQLRDEYRTYKHLQGSDGIPNAYYFGQEGLHSILVIDLLGPSLEDLFDWCGRRFSVKTVVQVAVQMLNLIEEVHRHDLIYRDIKPDNFLIGRQGFPNENKVHLIDFGMAKQYRDSRTKQHIPYREKKSLSGTARYMSINTHLGREQSRRDDLEALGHVFFYFLRGQLPWQGLKAPTNKQKYEKIGDKKRTTAAVLLCEGLPKQFAEYLDTVRSLPFEAEPCYEDYRMLLLSVLDDSGVSCDGDFDWMHINGGKGWDASINKKPNLHGYGHPTPPNDRDRRHRESRRNRPHHAPPQGNPAISASGGIANLSSGHQSQQQQQQLSAAQSHQQKLQHLINRPLPPIKQELQPHSQMGSTTNFEAGGPGMVRNSNSNYVAPRVSQYEQQEYRAVDDEKKGFWAKICCS